MSSPSTIIAIVGGLVTATRQAVAFAEQLGIGEDAIARLKRIEAKVNEEAAALLGPSVIALNVAVQLTAASSIASIDSLPEDPKCPRCGAVVRRWLSFNPATRERTERQACDVVTCGWRS